MHAIEIDLDLVLGHVEAHLFGKFCALNSGEVGNERAALNRLALSELNNKLVELEVDGLALMNLAVWGMLDARDGTILNLDFPGLELLFPVFLLGSSGIPAFRSIGIVNESNDVFE